MYRVEAHCKKCNRIYQLPMYLFRCPQDNETLELEFVTKAYKPEK